MDQKTYDRVLKAVRAQQARGVRVVVGEWGVLADEWGWALEEGDCACALGCLLLEEKPPHTDCEDAAGYALGGVSRMEVEAFTSGFDGVQAKRVYDPEWYGAGDRMARELGLRDVVGTVADTEDS